MFLRIVAGADQTKVRYPRPKDRGILHLIEVDAPAAQPDEESAKILATESKRLVILVEDDPSVRRAVGRLLVAAGFAVLKFAQPSALLESDFPKKDACMIVDVHLPEMNGVELCKTLAASGRRLQVIMITGHLDEATHELARLANPVASGL
jgi:CheY-like chemotaxis protein